MPTERGIVEWLFPRKGRKEAVMSCPRVAVSWYRHQGRYGFYMQNSYGPQSGQLPPADAEILFRTAAEISWCRLVLLGEEPDGLFLTRIWFDGTRHGQEQLRSARVEEVELVLGNLRDN